MILKMATFENWSEVSSESLLNYSILGFDLDDTLTAHGILPASVLKGLEAAQRAGWRVVLVTGRPCGWADALIKLLPFDAVVAENGAGLFVWPTGKQSRQEREEPSKFFWQTSGEYSQTLPKDLKAQHAATSAEIFKRVPRAKVSSDQPYRIYDLAIDFAEEVNPPLGLDEAQEIANIFESRGAVAKVSSIHVNGWWGHFSKVDGFRKLLAVTGWGQLSEVIYVGDSPNDSPLFEAAGLSVGVANVRDFQNVEGFRGPRYVCAQRQSAGALEVLEKISVLRRRS